MHLQQIGQRELKRASQLRAQDEQKKRREEALLKKYNVKARL